MTPHRAPQGAGARIRRAGGSSPWHTRASSRTPSQPSVGRGPCSFAGTRRRPVQHCTSGGKPVAVGTQVAAARLPVPAWVGADALKVLAGPEFLELVFTPQAEKATPPTEPADLLLAHEQKAGMLLGKRQPVQALAELEAALCSSERKRLEPASVLKCRLHTLVASAIAWSLDRLTDAGLVTAKDRPNGAASVGGSTCCEQALEMLCLAEMLTRREVADTFGAGSAPERLFFRALTHAGLGIHYRLRHKPRAALRFLEHAASGNAGWAHPAVLLNLAAAHALLRQTESALAVISQAVLSLRSATGRLCEAAPKDVEAAAEAATAAVVHVLGVAGMGAPGSAAARENIGPAVAAPAAMSGSNSSVSLAGSVCGGKATEELNTPHAGHCGWQVGAEDCVVDEQAQNVSARPSAHLGACVDQDPTWHNRVSRIAGPTMGNKSAAGRAWSCASEADEYIASCDGDGSSDCSKPQARASPRVHEVEAAVVHTLLVAKVLLRPWPEFREDEAVACGSLNAAPTPANGAQQSCSAMGRQLPKERAGPGIARHAALLRRVWPLWGHPLSADKSPGGGLVLRECLLLCFLHAASVLTQWCPPSRHGSWVLPLLREGLALAIVLFGPKHPLALKLINAFQKICRRPRSVGRAATTGKAGAAHRCTSAARNARTHCEDSASNVGSDAEDCRLPRRMPQAQHHFTRPLSGSPTKLFTVPRPRQTASDSMTFESDAESAHVRHLELESPWAGDPPKKPWRPTGGHHIRPVPPLGSTSRSRTPSPSPSLDRRRSSNSTPSPSPFRVRRKAPLHQLSTSTSDDANIKDFFQSQRSVIRRPWLLEPALLQSTLDLDQVEEPRPSFAHGNHGAAAMDSSSSMSSRTAAPRTRPASASAALSGSFRSRPPKSGRIDAPQDAAAVTSALSAAANSAPATPRSGSVMSQSTGLRDVWVPDPVLSKRFDKDCVWKHRDEVIRASAAQRFSRQYTPLFETVVVPEARPAPDKDEGEDTDAIEESTDQKGAEVSEALDEERMPAPVQGTRASLAQLEMAAMAQIDRRRSNSLLMVAYASESSDKLSNPRNPRKPPRRTKSPFVVEGAPLPKNEVQTPPGQQVAAPPANKGKRRPSQDATPT